MKTRRGGQRRVSEIGLVLRAEVFLFDRLTGRMVSAGRTYREVGTFVTNS